MNVVVASVMVEPLGWMIVHSLWLLFLPFVTLVIGLRLVPEQWSRVRYAAALATLCFMVLLPFAVLPWVAQTEDSVLAESVVLVSIDAQEPHQSSTDTLVDGTGFVPNADLLPEAAVIGPSDPASDGLAGNPRLIDDEKVPAASSAPVPLLPTQRIRPLLPWAVGVWFAGALTMTIRLLVGWRATVRLKESGSQAISTVVHEMFDELKQLMGVNVAVRVMQSALVRVPSVVGHFQPVVLLPVAAITGLSPDQLRAILAHELAHIRRYDYAVNILQAVIETVLFYHPIVWWVSRIVRDERENCCDDLALAVTRQPAELANALMAVDAVRVAGAKDATDFELATAANGGDLLRRIRRIARQPGDPRMARRSWVPAAVVLGVLIAAVSVSVVPQKVDARDQEAAKPGAVEKADVDVVANADSAALSAAPVDVPLPIEAFPSIAKFPASGTGIRVKLDDRRWVEFIGMASVDKINDEDPKVFWRADGELIGAPKDFDSTILVPDLVDDGMRGMTEVSREVLVQVVGPKGTRVGMSTSAFGGYGNFAAAVNAEFEQFPLNNSLSRIRGNHAYVEVSVTREDWEDVPSDEPEIARLLYSDEVGELFSFFQSQMPGLYVLAEDATEFAWKLDVERDNGESLTVTPTTVSASIDRVLPKRLRETLDDAARNLPVVVFFFEKDKPMPKVVSLKRSRYDRVRFDNLSVFPGPRSAVQVSLNGIPLSEGVVETPVTEVVALPEADAASEDDNQIKVEQLALTGIVVDSNGQPVSNCWVGMFTERQDSNVNEASTEFVDAPAFSHEARTDAKGQFTIIARKTHFVFEGAFWAVGQDGASGVQLLDATWPHTKDNVEIRIDDRVGEVRVLDPDGQPVSKATVTLEAVQIPRSVTWPLPPEVQKRQIATTDENGVVQFLGWPSAAIRGVGVSVDGYGTQILDRNLASRWVTGAEPLRLTLRQTGSFRGRIEGFDVQQHHGLRLQVKTEAHDGERPRLEGRVVVDVQDDGSFAVDSIAAGGVTFVSSLSPDSLTKIRYSHVPLLKPGEDRLLEQNPRLEKAVVVRQQLIKGDTGEGIPGISLRALWGAAVKDGSWRQSKPTRTDNNGWWTARVLPGKINVRISGGVEGYSKTAWFDGRNGQLGVEATIPATDQVVTLPPERYVPSKKLSGRLQYPDGTPAVDWSVYGHPISWNDVGVGGVHTDGNGSFTWSFPVGYPPRLYKASNREWMTEHNFTDNYVRPKCLSLEPFVLEIPAPEKQ